MKFLLLFISGVVLWAQPQILEDWNCSSGAIPTAGNPTTFTCGEAHNYVAGTRVAVWNATGGSWTGANTEYFAYLRLNMDASSTVPMLVTDTSYFPPTGNFTVYIFHEQITVNVASIDTLNVVARGVGGSTPATHPLGDVVYGDINIPVAYAITVTGANTFTIPLNSTGWGAYTGSPIILMRHSFTNSDPYSLMFATNAAGGGQENIHPTPNHTATMILPGCTSPTSANQIAAFECSRAFGDPGGVKSYGAIAQISSLVVTGGVGTVNLSAPFLYPYNGQSGGRTAGADQLIWIEGINEGSNAFNSINRPWIMSAINMAGTVVTIPGMGGQGVADGTYNITGGAPWNNNNLWLIPYIDFDYYFLGDVSNGAGFPSGYIFQYVKNGTAFNVLDNRVSMSICWGKDFTYSAGSVGNLELGNYWVTQPSGSAGYHGYQDLNINGYANQCGNYVFNSSFAHYVGQSDPVYNPNDAPFVGWPQFPPWTGENTYHQWNIVNRFYVNGPGVYTDFSNQTITFGPLTMDYVSAEPEEYVLSRGVIYNGSAYEVTIQTTEVGVAAPIYQFRHSTSDMKSTGFSTGLCKSGTTTCNGSDSITAPNDGLTIPFVHYTSANLSQTSTMYWAVRPTLPISGTSGSGITPIWINTDYDPNMQIGDHITVAGLTGNTAGNQTAVAITGLYARKTWYFTNPSVTWPTGATPGELVNIVSSGTVCTVNLTVSHNLQIGMRVVIYSTASAGADIGHGYRQTVASIPTATSFTYACTASAGTYAVDGGGSYHMAVTAEPGVSVAGTGNGNWGGETTGTLIATDNTINFAEIALTTNSIVTQGRATAGPSKSAGPQTVN